MDILKAFVSCKKSDRDVAIEVLKTEAALSRSDAVRVVDVITKYIRNVNAKTMKAMQSTNPTESARMDFTSEVVSLYDELVKDDPPGKEERKKSLRALLSDVRNVFASFYGRVIKGRLFKLNDEHHSEDDATMADDHGLEEDAVRNLAVEVESMSFGKSVLDALEKDGECVAADSEVNEFIQAALCSDYLSDGETRLKFVLSHKLFVDEYLKKQAEFSTTSALCLLAIAVAMKGCDTVSSMKYNSKMLQLKMCASAFLGEADFMGSGKGE